MLEAVRDELDKLTGDLPRVARESGIRYDTVHRIKNGEGDPAYGKVRRLYDYFFKPRSGS